MNAAVLKPFFFSISEIRILCFEIGVKYLTLLSLYSRGYVDVSIDKKEVDKAIKKLKIEEKIFSPKRCFYEVKK